MRDLPWSSSFSGSSLRPLLWKGTKRCSSCFCRWESYILLLLSARSDQRSKLSKARFVLTNYMLYQLTIFSRVRICFGLLVVLLHNRESLNQRPPAVQERHWVCSLVWKRSLWLGGFNGAPSSTNFLGRPFLCSWLISTFLLSWIILSIPDLTCTRDPMIGMSSFHSISEKTNQIASTDTVRAKSINNNMKRKWGGGGGT